jgi:ABC-2 type transport system ATP-binding protein
VNEAGMDWDAAVGSDGANWPTDRRVAPADVDLGRVWAGVAAEVWRRRPGPLERLAGRLTGSPGLARALVTTPSLLLGWVIATAVVLAAGAAATLGTGTPYVALFAPGVAAAGIAYAYGPGIDPAWELSQSMAVSDRMVLLVRALAVFGLNAALGLAASAASGAAVAITFGWLVPDDRGLRARAGCRDAGPVRERGRRRGPVRMGHYGARRAGRRRQADRRGHQRLARPALSVVCGGVRRPRLVCDPDPERNIMNVELTELTRRFGRTRAVDGVSLQAGPGVFGLLGPNGAGKTSLLRMMATVLPPTSGKLRLLGRDPAGYGPRREIRRRLGYLPQSLGYYPGFTVAEFVEYFGLLKDMPPGRVPRAVAAAIEHVGLGDKARAKLRTLSGGMLRRAGIAQAIVNDPELLLLDEPTAGLDPEQRMAFRGLLRDLGQRATVIVSTHLVEDVGAVCTEVALMDAGKIVFHGTPEELTARGEGSGAAGDAPLERGYSAVLAAARSSVTAARA